MTVAQINATTEQKMVKAMESLAHQLARVRTGRAHVGALDTVQVDYYGAMMPINQVANITLVDSRTIGVSPWEKKLSSTIEKAIRDSGLGLNPVSMGDSIRVPMPPLSEERRKELVKVVKTEGEAARVGVRNLRRDANAALKELVKAKSISEDDDRRAQDETQKMTDRFIAEIEKTLAAKEKELLTV
jgi:ribosome recycling factor